MQFLKNFAEEFFFLPNFPENYTVQMFLAHFGPSFRITRPGVTELLHLRLP